MFPLRHPNIVQLRQVFDSPTSVSLVMELMAGASVCCFVFVCASFASLPEHPPPLRPRFLRYAQAVSCLTAS